MYNLVYEEVYNQFVRKKIEFLNCNIKSKAISQLQMTEIEKICFRKACAIGPKLISVMGRE